MKGIRSDKLASNFQPKFDTLDEWHLPAGPMAKSFGISIVSTSAGLAAKQAVISH